MVINYSNLALNGYVLEERSRSVSICSNVVLDAVHQNAGTLMAS